MSHIPPQLRERLGRATIGDQLRRHAQHTPDKAAIIFYRADGHREVYTYAALNSQVNRFAKALQQFDVQHGDVVSILARNSPDYITAWYACLKLGAMFSSLNFTFTEREISYQANHCKPKVLIVEDVFAERVAGMVEQLPSVTTYIVSDIDRRPVTEGWPRFSTLIAHDLPDDELESDVCEFDVAMIQYTSGTESFPKGVMITHRNYLISTTPAWMAALGIKPSDIWLFVMPFFTIAGLGSMTTLTLVGATIILVQAVDTQQALSIIAAEQVTIMAQTPTFYLAMTQVPTFHDAELGSLEHCLTYGGTVPRIMIDEWRKVTPRVVWGTYWGQSELSQLGSVGWFATLDDVPDHDMTWIGKPVPQLEVRVVDDDGNDVEVGELICRSPSVMLGYYADEERTAHVFRNNWLHTGDIVRRDAEGNLFFHDRAKDVIKTGGMNVSSQEVERVLYQHPAVFQTAVVGLPDAKWSEAVTAFVVSKPGVTAHSDEMLAYCRQYLAAYKVPKVIHVVDALPKDTQGKVLKRELRRIYSALL